LAAIGARTRKKNRLLTGWNRSVIFNAFLAELSCFFFFSN